MRFSPLRLFVALTLLALATVANAAPVKFPPTLAGMKLTDETDYEKDSPGLGTGWSYRSEAVKADVYLYTGGLATVPAELSSPIIAGHFQEVVSEVYAMKSRGLYTDVRTVTPEEKIHIGSFPFLHAELTFTQENEPRVSHIYLGVWRGQFLKIRFTYFVTQKKAGQKALAEFLPGIVKLFEAAPQ